MPWLFVLFLAVPLIEVYVLIEVGGVIGAWPTILLVILTAILGAFMLRVQGFYTLQRVREQMAQGQLPAVAMLEGVVLLMAGALLLTPGFFTDAVGFLCLVPPLRQAMIQAAIRRVTVSAWQSGSGAAYEHHPSEQKNRGSRTLEGEYRREDD